MKIFDLFKLGNKKIYANKKRSVLTVVIVGMLFGLLHFVNFLYAGFEELLVSNSLAYTNGKVYLAFGQCQFYEQECESPEESRAKAEKIASEHSGVIEGEIAFYRVPLTETEIKTQESFSINHPELSVVDYRIETVYPEFLFDMVPDFFNGEEETMVKRPSFIKLPGEFNILELVFSHISTEPYINALKVKKTIISEPDKTNADEYRNEDMVLVHPVLSFSNVNDVYRISEESDNNNSYQADFYEPVGNILSIKGAFKIVKKFLRTAEIVLAIIATIIIIFTFIRLIDEGSKNIALYRSLGASAMDVFAVYAFFIISLTAYVIIFAIIVGAGSTILYSTINAEKIITVLTAVYGEATNNTGVLMKFNAETAYLSIAIMISGAVSLILAADQLSTRNIVKKLKK